MPSVGHESDNDAFSGRIHATPGQPKSMVRRGQGRPKVIHPEAARTVCNSDSGCGEPSPRWASAGASSGDSEPWRVPAVTFRLMTRCIPPNFDFRMAHAHCRCAKFVNRPRGKAVRRGRRRRPFSAAPTARASDPTTARPQAASGRRAERRTFGRRRPVPAVRDAGSPPPSSAARLRPRLSAGSSSVPLRAAWHWDRPAP